MFGLFGKKKQQSVNVEIDYDKLADSIAKALEANQQKRIENEQDKILVNSIEKALNNIRQQDEDKKESLFMTANLFSFIPYTVFYFATIILYAIGISILGMSFYDFFVGVNQKIGELLLKTFIALFFLLTSFSFGGTAYETDKIKDINLIIGINSALFAIIAAIISFATLIVTYKGMS